MLKLRRFVLFFLSLLLVIGSSGPWPAHAANCPCSIWPSTATPANASVADANSVELGVKFRTDTAGYITGIRFYKGTNNTGTHIGNLWSSTGTQLATATFSGETTSGWQQVNFASAVAVAANTTYIASYYAPAGNYAADGGYFTSTGTDNAPLHALKDGVDGSNGVYKYGSSGFPNSTYNATNYWVDVVFNTVDTTPPSVASVSPLAGSTTASTASTVSATFSKSLDATTVNSNTFELRDSTNTLVPSTISYDATNKIAKLQPNSALNVNASYTATLHGGGTDPRIKDTSGNAMAANYTWSFTTAGPLPSQGAGGPILVINGGTNPYSAYYTEILRNEGYTNFATADLSTVTSSLLNGYDVVILGELPLTSAQVTMLTNWVNAGGNLIAMKPDKQLAGLLGLTDANSTLSNAYLKFNTSSGPGQGLTNQSLQYHGTADKYTLSGANQVAELFSNLSIDAGNPAVTMKQVGDNGGNAAAFTYDLAKSVVQTRQGNPSWAGQDRNADGIIRSNDLFYGPSSTNPQPNWVDFNRIAIPQADEQQRLLGNLLTQINLIRKPLPHFWYMPNNKKAAVIMTGDDHGNGGTAGRFDQYIAASPTGCNVANWECIRSTSYIYASPTLTNSQAVNYTNQGFEVGLHVNTNCADWTSSTLPNFFSQQLSVFTSTYPGIPSPTTNRTHCVAWSDWATQPKVENGNGMRLDTTYYYFPANWVTNKPGFMTGSGMPMRFADTDGSLIDTYQAATQLTDESGQTNPYNIDTLLDNATGSLGYYGVFTANMHTDTVNSAGSDAIIASAKAHNIPVVSAKQMLNWLDGRNNSTFTNMTWDGTTLGFGVSVGNGAQNLLRAMLPTHASGGKVLSGLTANGAAVSYSTEVVKGVEYAIFAATASTYSASYTNDTSAPVVITISPANAATGVLRDTKPSASFNKQIDPATVTNSTAELRDSSNNLVPTTASYDVNAKQAIIAPTSPLASNTTYTATIHGGSTDPRVRDLSGNALGNNFSWSFTTGSSSSATSVWPAAARPSNVTANDSASVELGVKFRSDVSGYVKSIRFYKGPSNTGTHTGSLWSSTGQLLTTATFTNESASGWQQVDFTTPVAVNANTTYIASYHAPVGMYSADNNFFASGAADNAPIHALQDGTDGGNGVYTYSAATSFPSSSFSGSNYWVDLVFSPTP